MIDADRVGELLGGQPPDLRTAEHVGAAAGSAGARYRRHLVGARRHDRRDQMLQVVAVLDEIGGQPVEQLGTPRLAVHLVGVRDDAAAEQPLPDPVDDRARQAAVARIGEDRRRRRAPIRERRGCAGARFSSGNRNAGPAYWSCATSQRYSCSLGSGEKYAASPYASFSFHLLMKLSWHELHFRLMPRKTCAVFCAACIHGVSPRSFRRAS